MPDKPTKPTKPTQVEILEAIMGASQIIGYPLKTSIEDAREVIEAIRTIDAATKALHRDNGGPLTSRQLMNFIATNLGVFIGHQATETSKIPELVVESTRTVMEAAVQASRLAARHRR